jgi:hypothetical protein
MKKPFTGGKLLLVGSGKRWGIKTIIYIIKVK